MPGVSKSLQLGYNSTVEFASFDDFIIFLKEVCNDIEVEMANSCSIVEMCILEGQLGTYEYILDTFVMMGIVESGFVSQAAEVRANA